VKIGFRTCKYPFLFLIYVALREYTYIVVLIEGVFDTYEELKLFTLLLVTTYATHEMPNKFVDGLLSLLCHTILPQPNTLPKNFHEAKNMIEKIRFIL
jgi:hypothetical protein